ncbi:unnamed protein product [Blepharisma stoltei]|uniref:Uncharacterized protein n=1 Tax=Blepharisma stoltei TaxID=1481888 RepID=A0AAU9K696_9CILI|nr:unnamed protein product [Blepharisma stoltei]
MKKSKKRYHTLSEVWEIVTNLENKTQRLPELLGFRSIDIGKGYKKLITLCNSLSIIFLQYNLQSDALKMLRKASDADNGLQRFGIESDKCWQGSLITYTALALFFHKVGHYQESLKLLFQAQNSIIKLKETGGILLPDVGISVNMLTFVALWKIKRFKEATGYLESAGQILNSIIRKERVSKMSTLSTQNLYGLILMGLAGLKAAAENNITQAIQLCIDGVEQLEETVVVRSLLEKLLKFLSKSHEIDLNVRQTAFNFTAMSLKENAEDWLITKEFEKILFLTTFLPLIAPNTPMIRESELTEEKQGETEESADLSSQEQLDEVPSNEEQKPYLQLIKNAINKKNFNFDVNAISRSSRRNVQSTPKRRLSSPKHWWESKKILKNMLSDTSNAQIEIQKIAAAPRYRSEPRTRDPKFMPKPPSSITSMRSNRLMPMATNLNSPNLSQYKSNIMNPKDHRELIMLEFNPTLDASGKHVPVELVPMTNYSKMSSKDARFRSTSLFDEENTNICD